ncbi:SGNH/GDSL hydrolase family protein [Microbacterium sp. Marseille-Q6965]|uniref:SGNH/GDSL hydrolase family protein n=1 Tax=Microbacterium sp. Marseille-Q6965 TaxID=2965072 RepID=UPI0021B72F34|nr:SGNH/GDSL hydrolase family protein [Microbacterium sp. Marseille-Q6965]
MRTRHAARFALVTAVLLLVGAAVAVSLTRAAGTPAGCDDIRAYQERYGEIETLGGGEHRIAVLGDSYAAGDARSDRGARWTDALAQADPALTVRLDAVPFTGFVNDGACGPQAFTDRIDRVAAVAGDALVIQGGLNDVAADPDDLRASVRAVLDAAASVPRIVVVGPMDVPGRDGEAAVDALLAAEAHAHGATYVSALDWHLPVGRDDIHLTAAGHAEYAERIRDALSRP